MGLSLQAECFYSLKLLNNFFVLKKNKGRFSGFLLINIQVKTEVFSICAAGQKSEVFFFYFQQMVYWGFFWPYTDGADVSPLSCYLQHIRYHNKTFSQRILTELKFSHTGSAHLKFLGTKTWLTSVSHQTNLNSCTDKFDLVEPGLKIILITLRKEQPF